MAAIDVPLVLRMPEPDVIPLREVAERFKDYFTIIQERDLTEANRSQVQGILSAGFSGAVSDEVMASLPNLRVIVKVGVGMELIDVKAATRRGIVVGNTPGISDGSADFAFALLMASARNVTQADALMRKPDFKLLSVLNWFGAKVTGSAIGIIGLGNIGYSVAKKAKGFDMKILYYGPTRKEAAESVLGAKYCSDLKDLLQETDFIVLCAELTPETRHMITATELSYMKPSATLINVARGGLINHDDLATALKNGVIRGAALDVTEPEPLPHDHALFTLPNVIITPHIATATYATRWELCESALENILAGLRGEQLPFPVKEYSPINLH